MSVPLNKIRADAVASGAVSIPSGPVSIPSGYPSELATASQAGNTDAKKDWIRELLKRYLGKYVREYLSQQRETFPSPVTSRYLLSELNPSKGRPKAVYPGSSQVDAQQELQQEKSAKKELNIWEFKIVDETNLGDERNTHLTRILSLEIKYSIGNKPEHCVDWLMKVPSNNSDERMLARVTNVHKNEVNFYSIIMQDMKLWLEVSGGEVDDCLVSVPTCFYAFSDGNVDPNAEYIESLIPNPEFTLVLEDLRAQGFGKRHFSVGLTFQEATEAVREIAHFHATAWVMLQHEGAALCDKWDSITMQWTSLNDIYLEMVRAGFKNLRKFKGFLKDPLYIDLIDTLLETEPKLPTILQDLLKPLPPPSVTTLVHMDLWTDNLLFRIDDGTGEPQQVQNSATTNSVVDRTGMAKGINSNSTATTRLSTQVNYTPSEKGPDSDTVVNTEEELECSIVDWQTVGFGRISHDLALLFFTSLDAEVRKSQSNRLIVFYCDCFQKIANDFKLDMPFKVDDIIAEYKDSCLLALLLSVARLDLVVSEESTLRRFFEGLNYLRTEGFI